jgi:DNA-binding Lrp family transcriptional regulator
MPKSSKEQIMDDERKVIRELKKNAKESIDSIGKNCNFSRQKVWRIIKRLEENGTIWGYSSVINDEKMNQKRYFILFKRTSKPISKEKIEIITKRKFKEAALKIGVSVESSYFIHGAYDWLVSITANSIKEVKVFMNLFNTFFSEGFISDSLVLEVIFPIEINGISNPNTKEVEEYFI